MSTEHRKPVVAFVMLALAAALVVGVQHADAQDGRLLAAAAGAGAHVQGTIVTPTETISSRGYDRLADLGPAFVSVREAVGHADASTVATARDAQGRESGVAGAGSTQGPAGRDTAARDRGRTASSGTATTSGAGTRTVRPSVGGSSTTGKGAAGAKGIAGSTGSTGVGQGDATTARGKTGAARGKASTVRGMNDAAARPGKATKSRSAAKRSASRSSRATTPSARSTTRLARVATAPRAAAVHPAKRPHRGGHGRR